jgi:fatty acid desaturase
MHVSNELEGWSRLCDVDRSLSDVKRRTRWLSIAIGCLAVFWAVFVAWVAIDEGFALSIFMTLFLSIVNGPIVWWGLREWRQRIDKLESQRAALASEALALRI